MDMICYNGIGGSRSHNYHGYYENSIKVMDS